MYIHRDKYYAAHAPAERGMIHAPLRDRESMGERNRPEINPSDRSAGDHEKCINLRRFEFLGL